MADVEAVTVSGQRGWKSIVRIGRQNPLAGAAADQGLLESA